MDISLYQAAAAMNASTRWQEVIADNLAAGQIPGFKKQELSFSAVQAGFMGGTVGAGPMAAQRFAMPLANTTTNFQPGELQPTGTPTDLAIEGDGFFQVRMPDGSSGYTRDGQFRLNALGQLATKQGFPVLSDNGPIQFDLNSSASITVAPTGEISQGDTPKGRIKLAQFSDPGALTSAGAGIFISSDPSVKARPVAAPNVRQGFLESANTSTMVEMSNMISAMRLYEANQRIIQMEDDRVSRLINDVGNPS
jgi:flagellar basal-body rod protein FlgF